MGHLMAEASRFRRGITVVGLAQRSLTFALHWRIRRWCLSGRRFEGVPHTASFQMYKDLDYGSGECQIDGKENNLSV